MNQLSERYLEDFAVGQTFGSGRLRIDGERALASAAEFDPQPFHLDEAAARRSILGELTARGWHTSVYRKPYPAPASPWQNGFAERLIGSIRRECLDHVIIRGKAHLHRILKSYADYYNGVRTHRSLNKDAPVSRPLQLTGIIRSHPILGALHHHYVRV